MSLVSHLYVPADNPRFVKNALGIRSVGLIFDLEDAIAYNQKDAAREAVVTTLGSLPSDNDVWVRINEGDRGIADAQAIAATGEAHGLWVPKAQPGRQLERLVSLLDENESPLELGLLIESAVGITKLADLVSTPRVTRVQPGELDLRADLGMAPVSPATNTHLDWMRGMLIAHARASSVKTIVGPVSNELRDLDSYRTDCRKLADLGFTGRACIHPSQIEVVENVFSTNASEREDAERVVERFEVAQAAGRGAYRGADGKMADAATVRRAQEITGRFRQEHL